MGTCRFERAVQACPSVSIWGRYAVDGTGIEPVAPAV
jgi:hypothetical protein